ncbi:Uroporphyrinogen-III C-methyltransferase [Caloramator mitchellensis]|uniref:uroporphyrinogen-III C-methyltransferase n=1 Tax=Caloramator mitchellensis TaxID=908809 RepID=A0A0R3JR16_CALMK|nr:uroporphyrinogen-III C-methyltransferase [Caloramator mitchellensis]KRQ85907.1 Uroporphyrinogen-III C-methyltransferase [Caloramator mitchellensis]
MGKVYLIGAGPYDEELISLKAIRVLKKCDVVLYDRLLNKSILKHLRDDCKLYYCGKESGSHYKTQEEINDMLVEFAKSGYTVGRIKGGDPYVFGRGSEEALRLLDEGIEFEVIPGITSAISALNYAGIPITHRKIAQSFHVFTGKSAGELSHDWSVIAKLNGTIVFLMGLESIEDIVNNLMINGMDKNKSCAVVSNGTSARQRVVVGQLENISKKVKQEEIKSPAIIAVGDVVKFREKLNWFENKKLFGKRICITRAKEQSKEFREKLLDLGAEVVEANSISIKNLSSNLDDYIDKIMMSNIIVFTSTNGVDIFFDYLVSKRIDIRKIKAKIACIGEKTEEQVKKRGIFPEIVSKEYVGEALFEEIKNHLSGKEVVFLPRAKDARPFLKDALLNSGCTVYEVPIYEAVEEEAIDIDLSDVDYFTFTSPSTVKNFIKLYGKECLVNKKIISIGPITKKELEYLGLDSFMANKYTVDGIIEKILELEG